MKKNIFQIALAAVLPLALTACFSDDSSLGDPNSVPVIKIEEMPAQSVVSYVGNHLTITPEINSPYKDSELEYTWYLYDENDITKEAGFRDSIIDKKRNLDFEVNLPTGNYNIAFEVKVKATGLATYARTTIKVTTAFSEGWYILKETEDGNTDIDLITESSTSTDLIAKLEGEPLKGTPLSLAMIYQQDYVNPDKNTMEKANMINVFSNENYLAYRVEDMKRIFDQKNICYAGEDNDDVYYNTSNYWNLTVMLSKKGVSFNTSMANTYNTGKYKLPAFEDDIAPFVQMAKGGQQGILYWSNTLHGVRNIDQKAVNMKDISCDSLGLQECLASGITRIGGKETVWFYTQNKAENKRYLHIIDSNVDTLKQIRLLDPDLHIANATRVAACGGSASYIYAIDGGKLYAYGIETGTEVEIQLPNVSEPISFVTNQWLCLVFGDKQYNYDHLVVGSQNGNEYKLWFFDNIVGGMPSNAPYKTFTGTGKIHSIRRAVPSNISSLFIQMGPRAAMPVFPTSE